MGKEIFREIPGMLAVFLSPVRGFVFLITGMDSLNKKGWQEWKEKSIRKNWPVSSG